MRLDLLVILSIVPTVRLSNAKTLSKALQIPHLKQIRIPPQKNHLAVYCLSDIHADSEKNQVYVRERCTRKSSDSDTFTMIIIPGDIGAEVDRIERVFDCLTKNYDAICFLPGNHEV